MAYHSRDHDVIGLRRHVLLPLGLHSFALRMSSSIDLFSKNSVVGINDLFDLCRDTEKLRIFLIKIGIARMLSDRSGVCEICGKGNVNLTKKEGTYYWKCGAPCTCLQKNNLSSEGLVFRKLEVNFRKHPMFNILLDIRVLS